MLHERAGRYMAAMIPGDATCLAPRAWHANALPRRCHCRRRRRQYYQYEVEIPPVAAVAHRIISSTTAARRGAVRSAVAHRRAVATHYLEATRHPAMIPVRLSALRAGDGRSRVSGAGRARRRRRRPPPAARRPTPIRGRHPLMLLPTNTSRVIACWRRARQR